MSGNFSINPEHDSEVRSIVTKYSIIMVIVLAIILMLLSTRGRVESFSPESMIGTIEKTAELFIRERLLDKGESLQRVEVVESNYSTVEWGEYTYDATIQYRTLSREEILFTRWKYSVKNDSLDLLTYSREDGSPEEP
ncbi:conserved protein of unknown function [Mesotoga infera]|uniref:Uncharacterized protein n=1 Tax=Mesotoga infera TaxID=1236046 RepID=A0A7Z7LD21_9BACT|nr:hypothetical protein [Mesotoga infera]SSC11649.1 conserved protein of unknown function [Mesotoga infera]HOI33973.1 hypothetical protein [Mesotoga infera]